MKTTASILLLVILCSCGGGGGGSNRTTHFPSPTNVPQTGETDTSGKELRYENLWHDLRSDTSSLWSSEEMSPEMKLRLGLELGQRIGAFYKDLSWKEVAFLGRSFLSARERKSVPDFKMIAKQILTETNR